MTNKQYRINVYENENQEEIVSRVRYNSVLDYWDGRNLSNGGVGRHRGLTKLKDGRYVLIYGTQWQGEHDYAVIISAERALKEILRSHNEYLLKTKKFKELNALGEELGLLGETEFDDDEEI